MDFNLKDMLPVIGSIFSALASAFSGWALWLYRTITKENKALKRALEEVRDQDLKSKVEEVKKEVSGIKTALETHIKEDNPALVAQKLETLTEAIRQSTSLQRHAELTIGEIQQDLAKVTTKLDADIKAKDKWLDNINDDFQSHIKDRSIHHGT